MKVIYSSHKEEYRGKKHDYLGMDLEFSVDGEVREIMSDNLKNIVSEFPESIQEIVATSAADQLFTAREDANRKLLDEDRDTAFHHSVAKILFATTHVKKYIHVDVELLTTRVRSPGKYDWWKLQLFLQYIISTTHKPVMLRMDNLKILKW